MDFKDKVAVVTGAAKGIGRASAQAFAGAGAHVLVADIDTRQGNECVEAILAAGGSAIFQHCDCSDPEQAAALVDRAVSTWGRLDFAHNNAGITPPPMAVQNLAVADWERTIAINLSSIFFCMKAQIPAMRACGGGSIVNTASTAGQRGASGLSAYSASKHGVIGLTRSAALECAGLKIRVNAVCPGAIDTPLLQSTFGPEVRDRIAAMSPLGRIGTPQEVASLVLWLCSSASAFVTGAQMTVDGGMTA